MSNCLRVMPHFIDEKGDVYLCCNHYISVDREKYKLGNIKSEKLINILNSALIVETRRKLSCGVCSIGCGLEKDNAGFNMDRYEEVPYLHIQTDVFCNQRCKFCLQEKCGDRLQGDSLKSIFEVLHYIKFLRVQGGEPTVSKGSIELIKEYNKYGNTSLEIITNCKELSDEFKLLLVERFKDDTKYTQVRVSLNASSRGRYENIVEGGDFDSVIRNIRWLMSYSYRHNVSVATTMVISVTDEYDTLQDYIPYILFARSLGIKYIGCQVDYGSTDKDIHIKARDIIQKAKRLFPDCIIW